MEVQIVAALVACGADHEEALGVVRVKAVHHAVERGGAVVGTHMYSQAHIDHAGLAHRGSIVADVGDAVVDAWKRAHIHHHDVGIGSHAAITAAYAVGAAAAGGDTGNMGAVKARRIVGPCRKYLALGGEFATVAVARRGGADGVALHPDTLDAQGGARRVVEGGVVVLETVVDNAHHHTGAVITVGQAHTIVDVVDAQFGTGVFELQLRLASHVKPRAETRLDEGHIIPHRDADGQHGTDTRLYLNAVVAEGSLIAIKFHKSGNVGLAIDIHKAVLFGHLPLVETVRLEVGHQQGAAARHEPLLCRGHQREGQQHNNTRKCSPHCDTFFIVNKVNNFFMMFYF